MPNIAAKTSSNVFYKARCKAAAHNEQLSSREGAADIMSIDRGRIYRIESGITNPYPEEVHLMADLYNAPELENFYCTNMCPLGCEMPKVSVEELDRITLKALSALRKVGNIKELAAVSRQVVVMRGTPNHDGIGQFNVLTEMFSGIQNVYIVTTPQVLQFDDVDIAVLPGFDRGAYRAKYPGLSKEEENAVFTQDIANILLGMRAQCRPDKKNILMAHYTVPGCNAESGQTMMLTQYEPVITQETLLAAKYDLVTLGHIHRPQRVTENPWYYSGAINAMNFNDEGQERGFWIHEIGIPYDIKWNHYFHMTPIREFATIELNDENITQINMQAIDFVATTKWRGLVEGKIVRVHYSCSAENSKALNKSLLEKEILDDGAFMVWEVLPEKIEGFPNKKELVSATDPEANLVTYLEEKQIPAEKIQELVLKGRPIIAEAEAGMNVKANTGVFEPVEISVKNYRNYEDETFNFEDIHLT